MDVSDFKETKTVRRLFAEDFSNSHDAQCRTLVWKCVNYVLFCQRCLQNNNITYADVGGLSLEKFLSSKQLIGLTNTVVITYFKINFANNISFVFI